MILSDHFHPRGRQRRDESLFKINDPLRFPISRCNRKSQLRQRRGGSSFLSPRQGFIVIPDGGVDLFKWGQFSVNFAGQGRVLGL